MDSDVSPISFAFSSKSGGYFINFYVSPDAAVSMTFGTRPDCPVPDLIERVREEFENIKLNPSAVVSDMVSIAFPKERGEKLCQQLIENFLDYLEDEHNLPVDEARQELPPYIQALFRAPEKTRAWFFQQENKRLTAGFSSDSRLAHYDKEAIKTLAFRLGGNDTLEGVQTLLYDAEHKQSIGKPLPGLGDNAAIIDYLAALKKHESARDLLDILRNPDLPFIQENKRQCTIMHEAMKSDPSLRGLEQQIDTLCLDSMNGNRNLDELLQRATALRKSAGYAALLDSRHFSDYRNAMIRFTENRAKSGGATP